jgi:hypothetical protein
MSEITKLRDERIGKDARCETCRHAYPIKVNLKDTILECREGPPPATGHYPNINPQDGNIVNVRQSGWPVTRMVQPEYFCSRWAAPPAKLDS